MNLSRVMAWRAIAVLALTAAVHAGWPRPVVAQPPEAASGLRSPLPSPATSEQPWPLHVETVGESGESLVFIPGLGATTRYFRAPVLPLAATHRIVLLDLLGFGRSPRPDVEYTVDRHIESLKQALTHHAPFVLVGHSLGARLAVTYAARFPSDVSRLVLLSLPYLESPEAMRDFHDAQPAWQGVLLSSRASTWLVCALGHAIFSLLGPNLAPDVPIDLLEDAFAHTPSSVTSTLWESVFSYDLTTDLDSLDAALQVDMLHGDADPTAPLAGAKAAAQIAGATLVVLPGVDHYPLLRAPQAVLSLLADPALRGDRRSRRHDAAVSVAASAARRGPAPVVPPR